ncbi:MAG: type 1 glutamine amidotransferase [Oryzihumus sp.]
MPTDTDLTVVLVYPDLLGTYGDRGNGLALVRRAEGRGLTARLVEVPFGQPLPTGGDVYLVGGSEDAAQVLALRALVDARAGQDVLSQAPAVLAVCAGFQILGREFAGADGRREPGLGLLDVSCGRLAGPRAVGEVVARPVGIPGLPALTGYENHQGDASVGPAAQPLGRVLTGVGNGTAGTEGAVQGNVVGTYLHGPVLVRNPALADHLLEQSTGPLAPYEDEAVDQLRRERLGASAGAIRRRRRSARWRLARH